MALKSYKGQLCDEHGDPCPTPTQFAAEWFEQAFKKVIRDYDISIDGALLRAMQCPACGEWIGLCPAYGQVEVFGTGEYRHVGL